MKKVLMIMGLVTVTYAVPAQKTTPKKTTTVATTPKMSPLDSLSYAIGLQSALYYKSQGINSLNAEMVKKACNDVFTNKKTLLTEEQMGNAIQQKLTASMAIK